MTRIEVEYPGMQGPVEKNKREPTIIYEVGERGKNIQTPIEQFRLQETIEGMFVLAWGGIDGISATNENGDNAIKYGNSNFVNLRENKKVTVSQIGNSTPVHVSFIDDPERALVGARVIPPKPELSASESLKPVLNT